jgi:hypothetical protein
VLLAYVALLKQEAMKNYQVAVMAWSSKTAMCGKIKPPDLPEILKEQ